MTLSQHFRLAGMATMLSALLAVPAVEAADKPFGYTEGADIITVPVSDGRIDTISGVIFHQAKSLRAIDRLCMTVMVPRTTAPKPAVIYFPGGGFTSSRP